MKIMILWFLMLIISSSISCGQNVNEKVEISFLRYATNPNSRYSHYLFFCIKNNSSDTLYISENQISIVVTNKDAVIDEYTSNSGFPPPVGDKQFISTECHDAEKIIKKKKKMKVIFGQKLLKRNFPQKSLSKQEIENAIKLIEDNCIVLLPKSKTNFEQFFTSRKFEKKYKVKATIMADKEFCSFYDDNNNLLTIFNNP